MITLPGNCNGRSFSSPFCAVSRPSPGNSQGTACQCELRISHLAPWVSERELLIAFSMVRGVAQVQWRAPSAASITFASWNDAWEAKERLLTAEPLGPQVEAEIVGPFKGGGGSGTEGEWLREPWNNSLDLHQSAARMDTLHGSLLGKNSSSWSLVGRSCSFLDEESEDCGDDGGGSGGEMGVGLHTYSNPNNPSPRSFSLSLDDVSGPSMFATAERLGSNSNPWASSSGGKTISGYRSANNPNSPHANGISAENAPCNTLYVGNLPPSASEEELREMFCGCIGYKRLSFKNKPNGPMCFVEFEDIHCATLAMNELYGQMLSNSAKAGIRLSYSKNPLGVKPGPAMISHPQAQRGPCMTLQPVDLIPRISPLY